eukprot:m.20801 g.20801  ORF g.20801 m.20801 type:complete len:265 (+) comp6958_c0_seq1:568-1362(+)
MCLLDSPQNLNTEAPLHTQVAVEEHVVPCVSPIAPAAECQLGLDGSLDLLGDDVSLPDWNEAELFLNDSGLCMKESTPSLGVATNDVHVKQSSCYNNYYQVNLVAKPQAPQQQEFVNSVAEPTVEQIAAALWQNQQALALARELMATPSTPTNTLKTTNTLKPKNTLKTTRKDSVLEPKQREKPSQEEQPCKKKSRRPKKAVPSELKDARYWERREKNNKAARIYRERKRAMAQMAQLQEQRAAEAQAKLTDMLGVALMQSHHQ